MPHTMSAGDVRSHIPEDAVYAPPSSMGSLPPRLAHKAIHFSSSPRFLDTLIPDWLEQHAQPHNGAPR